MKLSSSSIYILCILLISCGSSKKIENQDLDESLKDAEEPQEVFKKVTDQKLPENLIILGKDTLEIEDDGKVFGTEVLGDNIYYYSVFKSEVPETDIGKTNLKVWNKNEGLLWSIPINNEMIRNDSSSILIINLESDCIKYYSATTGQLNSELCLDSYDLSDANEFITSDKGLYIKLVNSSDYSFEDVLFIDKSNQNKTKLGIQLSGYFNFMKKNGQIALIDNNKEVVTLID